MIQEAKTHAEEDKRRREEVEVRNSAESAAYQVERQMQELGDRVPVNERARAEQLIKEARDLVKSESADLARLRQVASDLQQIASAISSAAAAPGDTAAKGASSGGNGKANQASSTDDVIDAEFKEV
jgi:molecular chaperone DnaK